MSTPYGCPFCSCRDVRPLSESASGVLGYRCTECARTFFTASIQAPHRGTTPPPSSAAGGSDVRRPDPEDRTS